MAPGTQEPSTSELAGAGERKRDGGDKQARRWFALRVKSRFEKAVANAARNKGFEEFLPMYRSSHAWSDRVQTVDEPLFPGYVFCRLNPELRLPLLTIPGVLHFVGSGKTPVAVDDAEIAAIRLAVRPDLKVEPWPFIEIGNRVKVEEGPLAGLEGFLVRVRAKDRVVVSVSLLRRAVAVEIERDWIKPAGRRSALKAD